MKTVKLIFAVVFGALLFVPIFSQAEDVDIYSGLTGKANIPNVMIIMDNAANSDAQMFSCAYWDGTSPAGSKSIDNYMCALDNIVHSMSLRTDGTALVNLGITLQSGVYLKLTSVDDKPYTGTFPGTSGLTNRQAIVVAIRAITKFSGQATQGDSFQETWAYYTGGNGGTTGVGVESGTSYTGTNAISGCQKNYVIFISGVTNSAHAHTGSELAPLTAAANNAVSAGTITSAQGKALLAQISGNPENPWAWEWARFMYNVDNVAAAAGVQGIISYSVAAGSPVYPAAMGSMETYIYNIAKYGGGKYFAATTYSDISQSILKILNEVQAVNSVFASSSLPVSVNAQGTYLNQIYMGMFRPDANGLPRWVGNLKQYQFGFNQTTKALSLVDSLGQDAISGAGTGFISPNAVSFWTTKNTAVEPDLNGGFWRNAPQGAALGYDSPDGELVEKGGAAQVSRLAYQLNNYGTNPSSPRKVYTYCPGGTGCVSALSDASNAFSTSNAAITAAMLGSSSTVSVSTLTRSGTVATVTTTTPHNLSTGGTVTISGATQTEYNGNFTVVTAPSTTTFTITVPEYPPLSTTGSYTASVPSSPQTILGSGVAGSITRGMNTAGSLNTATATVTMVTNHGYASGQITIAGSAQTKYNGLQNITVTGLKTFTFPVVVQPISPAGGATATAASNVTTKIKGVTSTNLVTLSIVNPNGVVLGAETAVGTAPVTVTTTAAHNFTVGNSVTLANVVDSTGSAVSQYNGNFTIVSIPSATSFTYTTSTTPVSPATIASGSTAITVDFTSSKTISSLVRLGTTATATTTAAHNFSVGQTVSIGGTQGANEAAYVGSFTVVSVPTTTTFTYNVTLTPVTPATGSIKATGAGVVLDRTSIINWVRGEDNFKDEASPDTTYTKINIRPSLHGDVLHSRPSVVNYGGTTGVMVFYGANDGMFHAVNGNQTGAGAGSELWGFIPPEFIVKLSRMHDNSPVLKLASTPTGIVPTPRTKDYFIDGSTSAYQKVNADGTINTAYLFLSMRRGGQLLYALDVTTPTAPKFIWAKNSSDTDFAELGQTWSEPKVAFVKGYANPVLIFGAGYDTAEDVDPPATDTSGRGIFIVDALTGAMVWKATYGTSSACSGTTTKAACTVAGMNYSIPSDITLMDRSGNDSYVDRLYAVDTGGNIWRVDLEPTAGNTPDKWKVTQLAALGCKTGACASGTTPRKFFFSADMASTTSFDAVLVGSGDREHPLYQDPTISPCPNCAYKVDNRFYMVKDTNVGNNGSNLKLTEANLTDITAIAPATTTTYDNSLSGYYLTLSAGEKVVNAPLTAAGYTYFGTNTPATPSANSCNTNLGIAKGYQINPLTGSSNFIVYDGGGLPPSPVAGMVAVKVNGEDKVLPFCIGCGGGSPPPGGQPPCKSGLCGGDLQVDAPTSRTRTYWYKESD